MESGYLIQGSIQIGVEAQSITERVPPHPLARHPSVAEAFCSIKQAAPFC